MKEAIQLALGYVFTETPWYLLACVPFAGSARIQRRTQFLLIACLALARGTSTFFLVLLVPVWQQYTGLLYLAHYLVLILFFLCAFRVSPIRLAYVFLLVYSISACVNQLLVVTFVLLFPARTISLSQFPLLAVAQLAVTLALVLPLHRFFCGSLRNAVQSLRTQSVLLLCVTPALWAAVALVFASMGPLTTLRNTALYLLLSVAGIVSYFVNLHMLMNSARQMHTEHQLQTLLALQAQGYENLTHSVQAARAARHDLRHHLNTIQGYAQQGDSRGLLAYLASYTASLPNDDVPNYCENPAVNALLRHYLGTAAQAGAVLDVKIGLDAHPGIPDADLCVVFGNLFENAAQSVAALPPGEGILRARCETGARDIVLTVENTLSPAVPHGEGIGLKSVATIAKKYGGSARFAVQGNAYCSEIILTRENVE